MFVSPSQAQLQPDNTLGLESSMLSPGNIINGGAIRGSNLFHSFSDFNVNAGQSVYFANPVGIENILSRVTGSNVSNIDGTLGVNGTANLFLLNPNGIIFGENAALDISGSFTASTANSFTFADGSEFQAAPTAGELLTMSVPLGVQFNDRPQGNLTNAGNLTVGNGSTLTLFGKDVVNSGDLTALAGTVQVLGDRVALIDQTEIDVSSPTGNGQVFIGGNYQGVGDLPNATSTFVDTDVVINASALTSGDGGQVVIWADGNTRFLGSIDSKGGSAGGNGGLVEVSGKQQLDFDGDVDTSAVIGINGTLLLDPDNITIVFNNDTVIPGGIFLDPFDVPIMLPPIIIPEVPPANATDGLWSFSEDPGDQQIGINSINSLLGSNSLILQANDTITVDAALSLNSDNDLTLEASNIEVNQQVSQVGSGSINLITPQILGNKVSINTGGSIAISNSSANDSGGIDIRTKTLEVNGGSIQTEASGSGNGGTISIQATEVNFSDGGVIFTQASENGGNGGDITITGNSPLTLRGNGFVVLESSGVTFGRTGTLALNATTLSLENGIQLSTETFSSLGGGNIDITLESDLFMSGGSLIYADSTGSTATDSGNITIFSGGFLTAEPGGNNDIVAIAGSGGGGNLNVTTAGNTDFIESVSNDFDSLRNNSTNDLSASSAFVVTIIDSSVLPFTPPIFGEADVDSSESKEESTDTGDFK